MGIMFTFMQAGTKSVVTTSDHAQAREDAIKILNVIQRDLDRLVIDDMITKDNEIEGEEFPSVFNPIRIINLEVTDATENDAPPQSGSFGFFAFHHRRFYESEGRMELAGQFIEYQVKPAVDEDGNTIEGVDLHRNGKPINPSPLEGIGFKVLSQEKAQAMGVSQYHAFEALIYPRRQFDQKANKIRRMKPIKKLFHLKGVESQYACLLSLKRADAPYVGLDRVPEPNEDPGSLMAQYGLYDVPMDWIRPVGLVNLGPAGTKNEVGLNTIFDDETVNQHENLP
jgi:hypothetical protein